LTNELPLGITTLSTGGRTTVPKRVMKALKLRYTLHHEERVIWIRKGDEIVVRKGSPQPNKLDAQRT